jgi:glycosyltransferase involved in cell wall biosynthesis
MSQLRNSREVDAASAGKRYPGRATTACNAVFGEGGMGRALAVVVEEMRAEDSLFRYFSPVPKANDPAGSSIDLDRYRWLFRYTPLRNSLGARERAASELFDREMARLLPLSADADTYVGFAGSSLRTFRRARRLGYKRLVLESPTSHVSNVVRQHAAAARAYPIEQDWLTTGLQRKMLREYDEADEIVVLSEYVRESFVSYGIPEAKLHRRIVSPAARFAPPAWRKSTGRFTIVYSGRLHVTKGVPVLLDALARLHGKDVEVCLIGAAGSAGMERYVAARRVSDPRITIDSGDPLPHLHRADVLVHPSFQDGFGFAPMEALAVGVPVIVTEDTGMKEYVEAGRNGYVVPTGDVSALVAAIDAIRARPLRGTFTPFAA